MAETLAAEYIVQIPVLEQPLAQEPCTTRVDMGHDISYSSIDGGPAWVPAVKIVINTPFDGCEQILTCSPNPLPAERPKGDVIDQAIRISFEYLPNEEHEVGDLIEHQKRLLSRFLELSARETDDFNAKLRQDVRERILERQALVGAGNQLLSVLGIPLRRHDGKSGLVIPVKRRPSPVGDTATTGSAEYQLEPHEYDHIIGLCMHMSLAVERSPSTFAKMGEEDIRNIFLVMLNSHYEGMATGETFNMGGKTDILVRYEGRNAFIGECKIWHGAKEIPNAIGQLLDYTCWRDTKAALLIFARNKDFSNVVEQIPEAVRKHTAYVRDEPFEGETAWRFRISQPDDPNRTILLTVLAYHIPD
ncbi:MAG: hypothetical protein ABFE08_12545 [Armatimonadia bacterium]